MTAPDPLPPLPRLTRAVAAAFFLYELLYVAGAFATRHFFLLNESHRAVSLAMLIVLTFLMRPGGRTRLARLWDYGLMLVGVAGCLAVAPTARVVELQMGTARMAPLDLALGAATLVVLLEGTRRVAGPILPVLLLLSAVYAAAADWFPGILYGRARPWDEVLSELYLSFNGIFGSVLALWTNVLVVFIVFGGLLQASGAGRFFIRLALAVAGHLRGGAAKVAVLASGLFGTISGSAAADCATTGVVTIPMMKALGYRPAFAGAVEAVASAGGVLMPPVMGMVAFLIAEFLDIPYLQVAVAAAVPAALYYGTLLLIVDLEARRSNLGGVPRRELPALGATLKEGWLFFVPIGVLIYYLAVLRYAPGTSALYALLALAAVSFLRPDTRLTPARLAQGVEHAARTSLVVGLICGSVGILIASLAMTGMTLRMAVLLVETAGERLLPLLLLAGMASFVLGTGVPAIASYSLLAVTVAPAIAEMGVPVIAAHLFVLYWGLTHLITPPVGGALYIAASFAHVDIWRQGFDAVRLGIGLYLVPFLFCYHPELVMIGTAPAIAAQIVLAAAAMGMTACAIAGYLLGPLGGPARVALAGAAAAFIVQGTVPLLLAAAAVTTVVVRQLASRRAAASMPPDGRAPAMTTATGEEGRR